MEINIVKILGGAIYNDNTLLLDSKRNTHSSWDFISSDTAYDIQSTILMLWS